MRVCSSCVCQLLLKNFMMMMIMMMPDSFETPCIYDKITLTSHISFHSSVLASDSFACCHPTPALLMQTSNLLYLLRITWNISMMSDSRRRSQSTGNTSPDAPDCSTSSRIACRQQSPHTSAVRSVVYTVSLKKRDNFGDLYFQGAKTRFVHICCTASEHFRNYVHV